MEVNRMARIPVISEHAGRVRPSLISPPQVSENIPSLLPQVGAVVAQFGQNMDNARRDSQGRKAQTLWKDSILSFGNSLDLDTDYQTFEKRFNDHVKDTQKQIADQISHTGARADFTQYIAGQLPVEKSRIKSRANALELRFMKGEYFKQLEQAISREDREFIDASTETAIENGYLDPTVGAKARIAALGKVERTEVWNDIINIENREEVAEIVETSKLSLSEKSSMISAWQREDNYKRARRKEQEDEEREETQNNFLERAREGELTESEVYSSNLSPGEKEHFLDMMDKRSKAILSGKDNPLTILDPAVDFEVMRMIYSDTPPTKEEIMWKVGEGLTQKRAEHWIKQIEKPDTGYKRALDYLKSQITPRQSLLQGESSPDAKRYWNAVMELDQLIAESEKSGKPLRGNDLLKKAIEVAPAYQLSITERAEEMAESYATPEEEEEGFWDTVGSFFKGDEANSDEKEIYTNAEIRAILRANDIETTRKNVKLFREQNEK
jgi:hypothetical protein